MSQETEKTKIDKLNPEKQDITELEPETKKKIKNNSEQDQQKLVKLNENINTIICDIEGTTTPITFVMDILFPYARENMKQFIIDSIEKDDTQLDLQNLLQEAIKQEKIKDSEFKVEDIPKNKEQLLEGEQQFLNKILDFLYFLMDENQKITGLKNIQGRIWKTAYANGDIKGAVYDDAYKMIDQWKKEGKQIYIYSSGSVEAQKLLFQYSEKGDMLSYFSGHFDTKIGLKQENNSYKNILEDIKQEGEKCLFLTDRYVEAIAAESQNINVVLSVRDNTEKLPEDNKFETVTSFEQIQF